MISLAFAFVPTLAAPKHFSTNAGMTTSRVLLSNVVSIMIRAKFRKADDWTYFAADGAFST